MQNLTNATQPGLPAKGFDPVKIFYCLSFAMLIDAIGMTVIFPLMPKLFFSAALGFQINDIAFITYLYSAALSTYPLAQFFGMAFFGTLSDKIGCKHLLLTAAAINIANYSLCAFAILEHNFILFLCSRAISGFLSGSQSVSKALVSELSGAEAQNRLMNLRFIALAARLGGVIGPSLAIFAISTVYLKNGLAIPLLITLLLSVLNFLFLSRALKKLPAAPPNTSSNHTNNFKLSAIFKMVYLVFQKKSTRLIALALLINQFATTLFSQGLPAYLSTRLDYSTHQIGCFMLTMCFIVVASICFLKYLSKCKFYIRLLKLILLATTCVFFYASVTDGLNDHIVHSALLRSWVMAGFFFFSLPLTQLLFSTLCSESVSPEEQGFIMGATGQLVAIGQILATLVIGHTLIHHLLVPLCTVTFFATFLLVSVYARKTPEPTH